MKQNVSGSCHLKVDKLWLVSLKTYHMTLDNVLIFYPQRKRLLFLFYKQSVGFFFFDITAEYWHMKTNEKYLHVWVRLQYQLGNYYYFSYGKFFFPVWATELKFKSYQIFKLQDKKIRQAGYSWIGLFKGTTFTRNISFSRYY